MQSLKWQHLVDVVLALSRQKVSYGSCRLWLTSGWADGTKISTRTSSRLNIAMSVLSPWTMMISLLVCFVSEAAM